MELTFNISHMCYMRVEGHLNFVVYQYLILDILVRCHTRNNSWIVLTSAVIVPRHGPLFRQLAQGVTQLCALTAETPDDDVMLLTHLLLLTLTHVTLRCVAPVSYTHLTLPTKLSV